VEKTRRYFPSVQVHVQKVANVTVVRVTGTKPDDFFLIAQAGIAAQLVEQLMTITRTVHGTVKGQFLISDNRSMSEGTQVVSRSKIVFSYNDIIVC
jgi:hypothetical protein